MTSIAAIGLSAQSIVTTMPQHSAAVLEEYTGIHCQFCPDGHKLAKQFKASHPERVLLVNIHEGGYAQPGPGEPDFRTQFGTALAQQTGLTGYPTGTMNRDMFPQFGSAMAMSRSVWQLAGEEVLERKSPVNIGASSSYDPNTRTLTVNVEAYYTSNAAQPYNLLNVALMQDSILGPQTGAATWNPGDLMNGQYVHGHMLRHLITGQWGDTIANTQKGNVFTKTYTYVLPADVNGVPLVAKDCYLAIYATESRTDITQGISLGLSDMNDGAHSPIYSEISNLGPNIKDGMNGAATNFTFDLTSNFSTTEDFKVEVMSDAPSDWSVGYKIDGTSYTGANTVQLNGGNASSFSLEVTPGATAALSHFELRVYPLSDTANKLSQEFYVSSGVTDLVVTGSGGFGDGNTYNWESVYESGLAAAGATKLDVTDANIMSKALQAGALSEVNNIYLNIGWSFPAYTDEQANLLTTFMDNGGNVLIAGQDIGWDIMSGQGSGTAVTKSFYTNYLNASFKDDGGAANSQIVAFPGDNIYGGVNSSALTQAYGQYFYPDQIEAVGKGQAIFHYNNTSKVAGVRAYDGYKVVYLGFGLEMVGDNAVTEAILNQTYRWFNGLISVEEFDFLTRGFQVYPNPGNGSFKLKLPVEGEFELEVYSATGQLMLRDSFDNKGAEETVNISALPKGVYLFTLKYGNQRSTQRVSLQ